MKSLRSAGVVTTPPDAHAQPRRQRADVHGLPVVLELVAVEERVGHLGAGGQGRAVELERLQHLLGQHVRVRRPVTASIISPTAMLSEFE